MKKIEDEEHFDEEFYPTPTEVIDQMMYQTAMKIPSKATFIVINSNGGKVTYTLS